MKYVLNLIAKVPKAVWICLLSTLAITLVQGVFSYFFEYDSIKLYTKFHKLLKRIFLINLFPSILIFYIVRRVRFAVIVQTIFLISVFVISVITNSYYSVYFSCIYCGVIDSFIDVSLILIAIVSVALALFCFKKGKLFFTVFIVFLICATFKTIYYKSDRDFTLMNNSLSVEDKNLSDKRIKFKDSGNKIIFMHLAKTAGTSVIENFSKFYPSFSPSSFTCKDNPKVQRNVFIRSHNIKAFILPKFNLQNKSKITFFRDPRDRILSLYYYMISNSKKYPTSFTLLEYLNLKEKYLGDNERDLFIDNIYTRYFISRDIKTGEEITQNDIDEAISYLKTLDFIGITENFDEDLDRMSDFYYLPRPEKKVVLNSFNKNKVEYKKKMKKELVKEPITPEIEKELDRLTKYDYIIYNAAKKIRDEQVKKWKAGKMKRAMGE